MSFHASDLCYAKSSTNCHPRPPNTSCSPSYGVWFNRQSRNSGTGFSWTQMFTNFCRPKPFTRNLDRYSYTRTSRCWTARVERHFLLSANAHEDISSDVAISIAHHPCSARAVTLVISDKLWSLHSNCFQLLIMSVMTAKYRHAYFVLKMQNSLQFCILYLK